MIGICNIGTPDAMHGAHEWNIFASYALDVLPPIESKRCVLDGKQYRAIPCGSCSYNSFVVVHEPDDKSESNRRCEFLFVYNSNMTEKAMREQFRVHEVMTLSCVVATHSSVSANRTASLFFPVLFLPTLRT